MMILKTILVSMGLVAIVVLALGLKMLFDKNAKFEVRSCSFDPEKANDNPSCLSCAPDGSESCETDRKNK